MTLLSRFGLPDDVDSRRLCVAAGNDGKLAPLQAGLQLADHHETPSELCYVFLHLVKPSPPPPTHTWSTCSSFGWLASYDRLQCRVNLLRKMQCSYGFSSFILLCCWHLWKRRNGRADVDPLRASRLLSRRQALGLRFRHNSIDRGNLLFCPSL